MFGELEVELDMAFGRSERVCARGRAVGGGWARRLVHGSDAARGEGARARGARAVQQREGARGGGGAAEEEARGRAGARRARAAPHGLWRLAFRECDAVSVRFCPLTDIGRKVRPKASVFFEAPFLTRHAYKVRTDRRFHNGYAFPPTRYRVFASARTPS